MSERRKDRRQTLLHRCWIILAENEPVVCKVHDISKTGAQISVEVSDFDLPPEFTLALTEDRKVSRACTVKWRDGQNYGLTFQGGVFKRPRATYA
jgi:PilZ domain